MFDISLTFEDLIPYDISLSSLQSYVLISQKDSNGYASKKISLDNLAKCLNPYLFNVKSAAYCASSDFALISHDHDIYTSAYYVDEIYSTNANSDLSDLSNYVITPMLSVYSSSNENPAIAYVLLSPEQKEDLLTELSSYLHLPKLGVVEFIAVNDISQHTQRFDYKSQYFMGWVLADGSTYNVNDFMLSNSITSVFSCDINDKQFDVPNLNNFCKISKLSNSYEQISGTTYIPTHQHSITTTNDNAIQIQSQDISCNEDKLKQLIYMYSNAHDMQNQVEIPQNTSQWTYDQLVNAGTNYYMTSSPKPASINKQPWLVGSLAAGPDSPDSYIYSSDDRHPVYEGRYDSKVTIANRKLNDLALVQPMGYENAYSYPSHNLMPTFIYVGPSRYTQLSNFII